MFYLTTFISFPFALLQIFWFQKKRIDDYAKDGGEELSTKMHCVISSNFYRMVKDS